MKTYYIITVLFLGSLFFTACHEITTDNIAKVTYYVTFELEGGTIYAHPVGTPYIEPGVRAWENGKDVTGKMKVTGSVNSSKIGLNYITYSAVNQDGFSNSVTRMVAVYDPAAVQTDLSGQYSIDLSYSHCLLLFYGYVTKYADMQSMYGAGDFSKYTVTIEKIAPGIFSVSDFFGGYFTEGQGYSSSSVMTGYFSLNKDNSLTLLESHSDKNVGLDNLANAFYDPATGSIQWNAGYAGALSFNVKLNKK